MTNIFNNKKNLIIIGFVVLILVIALILAITNRQKTEKEQAGIPTAGETTGPQFMTSAEKADLRVSDDIKAQVLNRDASGTPTVYKIIKTDSDVVTDVSKIESISPRQLETTK